MAEHPVRPGNPEQEQRPAPGRNRAPEGAVLQPLTRVTQDELTRWEAVNDVSGQRTVMDPERGPANKHS